MSQSTARSTRRRPTRETFKYYIDSSDYHVGLERTLWSMRDSKSRLGEWQAALHYAWEKLEVVENEASVVADRLREVATLVDKRREFGEMNVALRSEHMWRDPEAFETPPPRGVDDIWFIRRIVWAMERKRYKTDCINRWKAQSAEWLEEGWRAGQIL